MFIALGLFASCSDDDKDNSQETVTFTSDFSTDLDGWEGDFADYPAGEEDFYELDYALSALPEPLNEDDNALMQTGNNHSDDLFMFIKKKVTGLEPNKTYSLAFTVEFATNAPEGSIGIGGSPASSVYIKAGASTAEPEKELDDDNYYRMNIDKGNQASGGANMLVLGDFSNGTENEIYTLVTLTSEESITVETDDMGEAWIILGTDSGFEATTTIYYTTIKVDFK